MFYAESPKLCLQRKLDKRPNRVADESGYEFYANSQVRILHYFHWTSVLPSYLNVNWFRCYHTRCERTNLIIFFWGGGGFFFFFSFFYILINSQADIKTHETRCLWLET